MPKLWTWRRILQIAGLAFLGILQAVAALVVGYLGSRALTVDVPFNGQLLPLGLASAAMLLIVSRILQKRYSERFALGYVAELRTSFMSHVLCTPVDTPTLSNGLIMTRVVNDMSAIKLWLSSGLVAMVVAAAVLLFTATALTVLVPGMAVTIFAAVLFWCIPVVICLNPLQRHIRNSRRHRGRIASRAGAALASRVTLIAFGRRGPTIRRFARLSQKLNAALVARASLSGLMRASGDLIFPVVVLITYINISWLSGSRLDAVSLGVLIMMTGLMATHLSAVALGLEYRLAHRVAMERIRSVFTKPSIDPEAGERLPRCNGPRGLVVEGVPVGHLGTVISFSAAPGEWVWLNGLSEAEADDLALKVARLKETDSGHIELDGMAADRVRARHWWRDVTVLSPRLGLFQASVETNATLGARSMYAAAEQARILQAFGLSEEIMAIPFEQDTQYDSVGAHAIRAARTVLRGSTLVLVTDADLIADEPIFDVFLREMKSAGATVILAGHLPQKRRQRFTRIDTVRQSAA
ncbi:MAG: ABC transporter ATP-binding protein [Pseudomonadota bacterium]